MQKEIASVHSLSTSKCSWCVHGAPLSNGVSLFYGSSFCVAYTMCIATCHDRIYVFVHESRALVTWSSKPYMHALRTILLGVNSIGTLTMRYFIYCIRT